MPSWRCEAGLSPPIKYFTDHSKVVLFWINSVIFILSCVFLSFCARLFIETLWSTAGRGLTSWFSFVMSNCVFVTFPCGILGEV